jgi:hypothetical protein
MRYYNNKGKKRSVYQEANEAKNKATAIIV